MDSLIQPGNDYQLPKQVKYDLTGINTLFGHQKNPNKRFQSSPRNQALSSAPINTKRGNSKH